MLIEIQLKRCKIGCPQPITFTARNSNLAGRARKELLNHPVNRIVVTAASALLIERIDKQRRTVRNRRAVQKIANSKKYSVSRCRKTAEQMRPSRTGVAQEHDVRLVDELRKSPRPFRVFIRWKWHQLTNLPVSHDVPRAEVLPSAATSAALAEQHGHVHPPVLETLRKTQGVGLVEQVGMEQHGAVAAVGDGHGLGRCQEVVDLA